MDDSPVGVSHPSARPLPGVTASRDYLAIMLQSLDERRKHRVAFRRMATDMAKRYLVQMEIFRTRGLQRLENLLSDQVPPLSDAKLDEFARSVDAAQRRLRVSDKRRRELMDIVEDYTPGPDIVAYRHAAGWYPAPEDALSLQGFLASRAPEGEHGQSFRYLSPTTDLMGWVCARAAGTTWAEAVSTYLWAPIGAEHDAEVTVDREGTPRAAGGLCVVPRDLARLGLMVARGGDGVVPEWFVDDLVHNGNPETWARGDFAENMPGGRYRSYWYHPGVEPDVVMGVGIHGQMLYVDIPRQVVVAVQSSWDEPDPEHDHDDNRALCRALAAAAAGG